MKALTPVLLLLAAMTLFSCEKFSDDENLGDAEANSTLVIRTRAAMAQVDEDAKVSYPVNVYVFNSSDACVAVETIASDADEMKLALPEGSYNVYAIAGADAENYELPTKENATKESVIALKADHQHGDLMTADNAVTLAYGEENTLTLSLERKVMMLENVTIKNVPGSVTAVSVTVSPLYENLLLDGTCSGNEGSYTLNLTREGETGTWKNDAGVYLLAAASTPATVKVTFSVNDKPTSYSYSCTEKLAANYKVNISGTYSSDGVEMKGQIIGETWEGTTNVVFDFDGSGSTEAVEPGGDDEDGNTNPNAPVVGQLYKNDCYVLKKDGNVYTLMTVACVNGLDNFDSKDGDKGQAELKQRVEEALTDLAVDGISGWRLPTIEEVAYAKEVGYDIQAFFEENVSNGDYRMNMGGYLLYEKSDGKIYGYSMLGSSTETYPTPGGSSYVLRAFTTKTFTN